MVYMAKTILSTNAVLGDLGGSFSPAALLNNIDGRDTVLDSAVALGLVDVLPVEQQQPMRDFLGSIPAAIDAAMMAALRSALARGLRVQVSWQPGYDFELRVWDVSDGGVGLVNVHLVSPHPNEAEPRVT